MRTSTIRLVLAFFAVALISACSNTQTTGGGSSGSSGGTTSSPVDMGGMSGSADAHASQVTIESNGNTIYFDYDKSVIRPDGRRVLMEHADRLKGGGSAVLEGHADERGSREYNIALGERRAKAVRDFLVIQGVKSTQLEVVSYGEERPADAGTTEMAYARNRRVEIK